MNFLPLNIAFKYFRSKRRGYLSFVSGIAFIGIALGVAVLILVSSVMNGFERELKERVLESIPHASVVGNIEVKEFDEIRSILRSLINFIDNSANSMPNFLSISLIASLFPCKEAIIESRISVEKGKV